MELKFLNDMPYWVYSPEGAKPGMPLTVFLHGAAERGNDGSLVLTRSLPQWLEAGRWTPEAYVLCPQCRVGFDWNSQIERLKAVIDHEAARLQADPTRISITGISMGGFGTWAMGLHYPEFFSAIAPVCGGGLSWRCSSLAQGNMPVWAFHGDADPMVPLRNSVEMVEAVNAAGGHARLTVFPGVEHNSWDQAYGQTEVLQWLLEQQRPNPVDRPKFSQA